MSLLVSQLKKVAHRLRITDHYTLVGTEAFKVRRDGKVFKLRWHKKDDESVLLHQMLLDKGIDLPKILSFETDDMGSYKEVEWMEGNTFRTLINDRQILPEHYEKLGKFVAKVNLLGVGYLNYLPKNLFLKDDGEVIVIDQGKLTKSVFPENAIIRYVLTEDLVDNKAYTFELRTAFLKGYRSIRKFDLLEVLEMQYNFCTDGSGEKFEIESIDQVPKYRPVQSGRKVLEIITGTGARALQEMLKGAEYVYSCDIYHKRFGGEIFKASDLGKFLAYIHGFDGRDLHYKWIELNSDHFINHLEHSTRSWDLALVHLSRLDMADERIINLANYLKDNAKEISYD